MVNNKDNYLNEKVSTPIISKLCKVIQDYSKKKWKRVKRWSSFQVAVSIFTKEKEVLKHMM